MDDHLASLEEQLTAAKLLDPVFVNSHSGSDSWSLEQSLDFFRRAEALAQKIGIALVHETHRQRVLFNPWVTRDVLTALPSLRVNADLSHFTVVAERVFDDGTMDTDWPGILQRIADQCYLVHCRVGYEEGPQVSDPAAPEYKATLETFESWWETIWTAVVARGDKVLYLEPEHGPPPYLHALPYTKVPVTDLWRVNSFIGERVSKKFELWQANNQKA